MVAQWTADVVGQMHIHGVTQKELAKASGFTPRYVGMILNGKRTPKHGELILRDALARIIEERGDG